MLFVCQGKICADAECDDNKVVDEEWMRESRWVYSSCSRSAWCKINAAGPLHWDENLCSNYYNSSSFKPYTEATAMGIPAC